MTFNHKACYSGVVRRQHGMPAVTPLEWKREKTFCMACGKGNVPGEADLHHIARGGNRSKAELEPASWLFVCPECHQAHIDGLEPVTQLALKWLGDRDYFDAEKVCVLCGMQPGAITDEDVLAEIELIRKGKYPWMNPYRWVM